MFNEAIQFKRGYSKEIEYMKQTLITDLTKTLKYLLENKHLYQNHSIIFSSFEVIISNIGTQFDESFQKSTKDRFHNLYNDITSTKNFKIGNTDERKFKSVPIVDQEENEFISPLIVFQAPKTIKRYCSKCKDTNPYNLVNSYDYLEYISEYQEIETKDDISTILLAYQCQLCKSIPEIFLIRFDKNKMSINGKSPIEAIEIPKMIPNQYRKYFANAIIAFNSGQALAGKFLLRTFIEQFLRANTGDYVSTDIEKLSKDYNKTLNSQFVESFPSLYSIYEDLSIDIHMADESEDKFIEAKRKIEIHFEGKAAFDKII